MTCIKELLGKLGPEIEGKIAPWLIFIRSYLPQNWVFRTEKEILTLSVSKDGKATVTESESSEPDVIIEWKHDVLSTALKTRDKKAIPPEEKPSIQILTKKGDAAYGFLRQTFGFQKK